MLTRRLVTHRQDWLGVGTGDWPIRNDVRRSDAQFRSVVISDKVKKKQKKEKMTTMMALMAIKHGD